MFAADPIVNLLSETIWLSPTILWIRCFTKPEAPGWKPPSSCHKVWKMWLNKPRFFFSLEFHFFSQPEIVSLRLISKACCMNVHLDELSEHFKFGNLSHSVRVVYLRALHCSNDQNTHVYLFSSGLVIVNTFNIFFDLSEYTVLLKSLGSAIWN